MQGRQEYQAKLFLSVDIGTLIPERHRLRRLDQILDLGFICEMTADLYCEDKQLRYKVHTTIDRESRIIIDPHITAGSDVEGVVCMSRLYSALKLKNSLAIAAMATAKI